MQILAKQLEKFLSKPSMMSAPPAAMAKINVAAHISRGKSTVSTALVSYCKRTKGIDATMTMPLELNFEPVLALSEKDGVVLVSPPKKGRVGRSLDSKYKPTTERVSHKLKLPMEAKKPRRDF